jgi:hypothetical protein
VSDNQQIIEILQRYNQWRRGDEAIEQPDPKEIGIAIDDAIKCIEQLDRLNESIDKNKRLFSDNFAERVIADQVKRIKQLEDELIAAKKIICENPHAEWQLIETAPKDGSEILAYANNSILIVRWADCSFDPPCSMGWASTYDHDAMHYNEEHPTHWMILPQAPNQP